MTTRGIFLRCFGPFLCIFVAFCLPCSARAHVAAPSAVTPTAPPELDAAPVAQEATATTNAPVDPMTVELAEIAVPGRRPHELGTVQRVTPAAIRAQDAASAKDLVRLLPGAHVPTNSRGESLLYLRDAGERQVAVFLDGAQLLVPWDNSVDLSLVPASLVGSMTLTKGASSLLWGPNVLGGAVNLITRSLGEEGRRTEIEGVVGSQSRVQGSLTHLGRRNRLAYAVAVGWLQHDDQRLPAGAKADPRATPFNNPDADVRTNTDGRTLHAMGQGQLDLDGGGRLALTVLHLDATKGIATESHRDPADAKNGSLRYWRYPLWQQTMAIAAYGQRFGRDEVHGFKATAWIQRFAQGIDSFADATFARVTADQRDLDLTAGARLTAGLGIGPGELRLIAQGLSSTHDQTDRSFAVDGKASINKDFPASFAQHVLAGGIEYDWRPAPAWVVRGGAGYDAVVMTEDGAFPGEPPTFSAPTALLGIRCNVWQALSLRAAAGLKTRFPTQRELFGGALGKFAVNPELDPESARLGEFGASWQGRDLSAKVTLFATDTEATIDKRKVKVTQVDAAGVSQTVSKDQRFNLTGSRSAGVELTLAWQAWRSLRVDGHLTELWIRAFDEAAQAYTGHLTRRPERTGTVTVGWFPDAGLTGHVQAVHQGSSWSRAEVVDAKGLKIDELRELEGSVAVNARIGWTFLLGTGKSPRLTVFAQIHNALDTLVLPTDGLPEPGRSLAAGASVAF